LICDWLGAGPGRVVGVDEPVAPAPVAENPANPKVEATSAPRAKSARRERRPVFRQCTDDTVKQ
jgi:hypothetical protein